MAREALTPEERKEKRARAWQETKVDLKWATALLFVLILVVSGWLQSDWRVATTSEEDLAEVSAAIFSSGNYTNDTTLAAMGTPGADPGLVVPFEVLSILLLAALIAGVVIAFRDPEEEN